MSCPLSPLISAWFLWDLDQAFATNPNIYYVRYMDDWLVLTKIHNHLRKVIKLTEQIITNLQLSKHPAKTFIGWIKTGFDFLGYHLSLEQLKLSKNSIERHQAKYIQLYEQGATPQRLEQYWLNRVRWAMGGLKNHITKIAVVHASCPFGLLQSTLTIK